MRRRSHLSAVIFFSVVCSLILCVDLTRRAGANEKMNPADIVRKHLDAIGAAETRASVTSRVIVGDCRFSFHTRLKGETVGRVVLASEGIKSLIGMSFPTPEYPFERLGYDGRTLTTGHIRPGSRTALGDFLRTQDVAFREGLMGGTLSAAWPLLDVATRNPRLDYMGTQKVNGRLAHELGYTPRKGSDFEIRLFFDGETFQHVRSSYTRVISAPPGLSDKDSAQQRAIRYSLTEEFSDFRQESGLTLPHIYKLRMQLDNAGGNSQFEWTMSLVQYNFNQRIPAESYNVEAYKPEADGAH